MPQIQPLQATTAAFPADIPSAAILGAILDGRTPGELLVDPASDDAVADGAVIAVADNGTTFIGRGVSQGFLEAALSEARKPVRLVVTLTARQEAQFDWTWAGIKETIERFEHTDLDWGVVGSLADSASADRTMRRMDAHLFGRALWYKEISNLVGGADRLIDYGLGFAQLKGDTIVAESYAIISERDGSEIGGITHEAFRRQGNMTTTCAAMLTAHLSDVGPIYWCCDQENVGSWSTARKLGFRAKREYRFLIVPRPE